MQVDRSRPKPPTPQDRHPGLPRGQASVREGGAGTTPGAWRRFTPDPTLYPFRSRWIRVQGHKVHYLDEGDGPTVVMLHGNPTWSFLYRKLVLGLRGSARCVVPDLPGFGLSEAPPGFGFTAAEQAQVVAAWIDALDLDDVILVGQDWGGPLGLAWAIDHPERVRGLVLGNTWAWPLDRQWRYRFFSGLLGGTLGRIAARTFNGVLRFFLFRGLTRPLPAQVRAQYHAPFRERARRHPTAVFPRELVRAAPFLRRVEAGLPRLRDKPVLLPWGARDFAFREPECARFEELFPRHRTIPLVHASHFWQEDAGEEVARILSSWPALIRPAEAPRSTHTSVVSIFSERKDAP